ncbi:glycosyltransferase [Membranihabitans marinus]
MAQIVQSNIGLETSNQQMDISDKRDGPIPIAVQEKTKNTSHLKTDIKKQIHFSIIVCYHQKPDDITSAIHWVLEQDYPYFELILVNDGDSTIFSKVEEEFLTRYSEKIKYIFHSKQNMGKRGALARGIAEAQNPYLVFTDIDCIPPSTWLSTIALHIQPHIQVILGVSPYLKNKQFLNQIVQHETFLTAVQYLGWAQRGMPYMGLGRNMVYHKDLYHADQFQKSQSVPYGDDDLWINKVARKDNTTTVIAKESFVPSLPPLSWSSWFNQKKRHLSAGKYYSRRSKMTIGIFSACLVIEKILLLSIICIDIQLFLYLILLKYIVLFVAIHHNKRRIGMVNSVGSFWLYEYFHFIYLLVISPYIFFISKPNW